MRNSTALMWWKQVMRNSTALMWWKSGACGGVSRVSSVFQKTCVLLFKQTQRNAGLRAVFSINHDSIFFLKEKKAKSFQGNLAVILPLGVTQKIVTFFWKLIIVISISWSWNSSRFLARNCLLDCKGPNCSWEGLCSRDEKNIFSKKNKITGLCKLIAKTCQTPCWRQTRYFSGWFHSCWCFTEHCEMLNSLLCRKCT